jgi:trimethylamine--corrinoid protein Co-methyltransferase
VVDRNFLFLVNHSGGWLEGGRCASFEKFIVDMKIVQMMTETLQPIVVKR